MITNLRFIFKKTTTIQKIEDNFTEGSSFTYNLPIEHYFEPSLKVALVGSLNNGKTTLYGKLSEKKGHFWHKTEQAILKSIGNPRLYRFFYYSHGEMVKPFLKENPSAKINKNANEEDLLALKLFSIEYYDKIMKNKQNCTLTDRCFIDLIAFQTIGKGKEGIREFIRENKAFLEKTLEFYTHIYFFIKQFRMRNEGSNNPNRTKDKKWAKKVHEHFLDVLKVMEEFSFIKEHEHKFYFVK